MTRLDYINLICEPWPVLRGYILKHDLSDDRVLTYAIRQTAKANATKLCGAEPVHKTYRAQDGLAVSYGTYDKAEYERHRGAEIVRLTDLLAKETK